MLNLSMLRTCIPSNLVFMEFNPKGNQLQVSQYIHSKLIYNILDISKFNMDNHNSNNFTLKLLTFNTLKEFKI